MNLVRQNLQIIEGGDAILVKIPWRASTLANTPSHDWKTPKKQTTSYEIMCINL